MTVQTSTSAKNLNAGVDGSLVAARGSVTLAHNMAFVLIMLCAAVLSLYKLGIFPAPWFDEGWWLQIPKNLALYNSYSTQSIEGFRPFDTVVSASPAFFLPAALSFQLFGVGLMQGRLVIALAFLVSCVLVHLIARRLTTPNVALLATGLFVLAQPDDAFTSVLMLARQYMGEIPALCCLLCAFYLLISALRQTNPRSSARASAGTLLVSGLMLGLAMTIKSQFMLVTLPTVAVLGIVDWFWFRQRRVTVFLIPIVAGMAVIGLNQLFIYAVIGPENYARFMADLSAAAGPQVRTFFAPAAMLNAVKFFARSPYAVLGLLAVAYALYAALDRKSADSGLLLIAVFVGGWMAWFSFTTVAWSRYAFPGLAVSHILVAKLLGDFAGKRLALPARLATLARSSAISRLLTQRVRSGLVALVLVGASVSTIRAWTNGVFGEEDIAAQNMSAYIDARLPKDAVVESWEWEVSFLSTRSIFHHPPTTLLNQLIAQKQLRNPGAPVTYDYLQAGPTHVLVGPFAQWTKLYAAAELDQTAELEKSFGNYRLYRITTR